MDAPQLTPDSTHSKTLYDRIGYLYMNEKGADVQFIFSDSNGISETIPAHKSVLISCSEVMESQFCGLFSDSEKHTVKVKDISAEVFKEFLRFAYKDEVDPPVKLAAKLLYTAKKYLVRDLEDKCTAFIDEILRMYQNDHLLLLEGLLELKDGKCESFLVEKCLHLIENNGEEALSSEQFSSLQEYTVALIIKGQALFANESTVLRALIKWSEKTLADVGISVSLHNQKKVLQRLLPYVRFPVFNIEELSILMNEVKILTDKELMDVILAHTNDKHRNSLVYTSQRRQNRYQPQTTVSLPITHFTNFVNTSVPRDSPVFYVRGMPWNFSVQCPDKLNITFTLYCHYNPSGAWECVVPKVKLTIVSEKDGCDPKEIHLPPITHSTSNQKMLYVYGNFVTVEALLNGQNGWYVDDSVILEVYIEADEPDEPDEPADAL